MEALVVAVPEPRTTISEIMKVREGRQSSRCRPHLGASKIGHACARHLWLTFRWARAPHFPGRVLRMFERGQNEELIFNSELRSIGVNVHSADPLTGKQFYFSDIGGHFGGSMDGCAQGLIEAPKTWHVLEFKTHNQKSFDDLSAKGVEKSKPEHYAQVQLYMHWSGMSRAYYLAVNKNDDDLYGERIRYDKAVATALVEKARDIITSPTPPFKCSNDPAWYICKFCEFYGQCHGDEFPQTNCRTCIDSTPEMDGDARWTCKGTRTLTINDQRAGCAEHIFIPDMIPAECIEQNPDESWVFYRFKDGRQFYNSNRGEKGHYKSSELSASPGQSVGLKVVDDVKFLFGAEVVK